MLVIRNQQIEALSCISSSLFTEDMVSHVRTHFPTQYNIAGELSVRQAIMLAIPRARIYGFACERDICIYITTMMLLGSNFDTDSMYPWVLLLLKTKHASPAAKANDLVEKTVDFYSKTAGRQNGYINRALLNVHRDLAGFVEKSPSENLHQYIKDALYDFYPQKYEVLGESIIEKLIDRAMKTADQSHLLKKQGAVMLSVIMFFLGSSVVNDPLVPWLKKILQGDTTRDQKSRTLRLRDASYNYLGQWLGKASPAKENNYNV